MDKRRFRQNATALNLLERMGIINKPQDEGSAPDPAPSAERAAQGVPVCTNTAVRLAARRLGQLYDDALAPLNLKSTQLALIFEIGKFKTDDAPGPALQDLAGRLAIQLSALTHALRPLVRDGIVELLPDALDRRTKRSVLTPLGQTLLSEAIVRWAWANERVETVLGPESAASLRALADQVTSDAFINAYKAVPLTSDPKPAAVNPPAKPVR